MKELFITWLLSMMLAAAPVDRPRHVPEARESKEQAEQRYREIAEAVFDASFDPNVQPVFPGDKGRASTAMIVTAMFYMESGFRRDVDLGTSRHRLRRAGLNDFGRSWCMGQINLGAKKEKDAQGRVIETSATLSKEGWTGPELQSDRRKCAISTINLIRASTYACKDLPREERLAAYAAGNCDSDAGKMASRARMAFFNRWVHRNRPNATDTQVILALEPKEEIAPAISLNP